MVRNPAPRVDGTHRSRMMRAQEQGGEIPNLIFRMPAGVGGGFSHHSIGTKANNRASPSFVTGAHNMKLGYPRGFNNLNQTYMYFNEANVVRMRNGVPNQLRQVIAPPTRRRVAATDRYSAGAVRRSARSSLTWTDRVTRERLVSMSVV